MICQDVEPLLSAYLDRELHADERSEVMRHLAACTPCRTEISALLSLKERLRAQPMPSIPVDLVAEIEARTVLRIPWWRQIPVPGLWAPALAAALALGVWAALFFHARPRNVPLSIPIAEHRGSPPGQPPAPHPMTAWHPDTGQDAGESWR